MSIGEEKNPEMVMAALGLKRVEMASQKKGFHCYHFPENCPQLLEHDFLWLQSV